MGLWGRGIRAVVLTEIGKAFFFLDGGGRLYSTNVCYL